MEDTNDKRYFENEIHQSLPFLQTQSMDRDEDSEQNLDLEPCLIHLYWHFNRFHSGYLQTGTLVNSEDPNELCSISSGSALFAKIN